MNPRSVSSLVLSAYGQDATAVRRASGWAIDVRGIEVLWTRGSLNDLRSELREVIATRRGAA